MTARDGFIILENGTAIHFEMAFTLFGIAFILLCLWSCWHCRQVEHKDAYMQREGLAVTMWDNTKRAQEYAYGMLRFIRDRIRLLSKINDLSEETRKDLYNFCNERKEWKDFPRMLERMCGYAAMFRLRIMIIEDDLWEEFQKWREECRQEREASNFLK